MSRSVKSPRQYDSSRRQAQARLTRAAVLEAARQAFLEKGYAATTVAAIAAVVEVSVETVYKAFGNKAGLLKAMFDIAIVDDDEPIPLQQRDMVARIQAEPDGRDEFPAPSIWPFLAAVATSLAFVASIFTPWGITIGSIPIAISMIGWFWPRPPQDVEP